MADIESRLRHKTTTDNGHAQGPEEQLNNGGIRVIDRYQSATQLMPDAAFLVTDISSVVSDFLVTGRPIFLYVPKNTEIGLSSSAIPMDQYCYIYSEPEELLRLVKKVIVDGEDNLRDSRLAARNYFVDIARTQSHQFETELRKIAAETPDTIDETAGIQADPAISATNHPPIVVAHRGVTSRAPENSLTAFRDAVTLKGLDAVEFDVHLMADGTMPIMHDPELDRTTNGKGAIGNASQADLQQLRLKGSPGQGQPQDMTDERIPTLEQVLEILAPSSLELHIEIKNDALGNPYRGLPQKVLTLIHELGITDRCILTSFTPAVLEEIRHLDGDIRLLASVNMRLVETLGGIQPTLQHFQSIGGCLLAFQDRVLKAMHNHGWEKRDLRSYGIWVVNKDSDLRRAFRKGYRQITTDRAETAIQIRGETEEWHTTAPHSRHRGDNRRPALQRDAAAQPIAQPCEPVDSRPQPRRGP